MVGVARSELGRERSADDGFSRATCRESALKNARVSDRGGDKWEAFASTCTIATASTTRRRRTNELWPVAEQTLTANPTRWATGSSTWPRRRSSTSVIVEQLGRAGLRSKPRVRPHHHRETVRPGPGRARRISTSGSTRCSTRARSTGSITTSARRPSRTSWPSASPTRSGSRCGTATTSITCRSRRPRRWAWRAGRAITRAPACCATCSRTTCCNCSRSPAWSRPRPSTPSSCATKR